jgi:hypothetical protein
MEVLRETQKKYCSKALVYSIFVCIVCLLAGYRSVGKGFVLGSVFSIINFIIMGETLPYRIGISKKKTIFVSLCSIGMRYLLMAVPIVMSIRMEQFNFFSVGLGLFSVQLVLMFSYLLSGRGAACRS